LPRVRHVNGRIVVRRRPRLRQHPSLCHLHHLYAGRHIPASTSTGTLALPSTPVPPTTRTFIPHRFPPLREWTWPGQTSHSLSSMSLPAVTSPRFSTIAGFGLRLRFLPAQMLGSMLVLRPALTL
jgi:hypothetical protein